MNSKMTDEQLTEAVAQEVLGWKRPVGWKFSDDIDPINNANHWMMVVERMREKGWYVSIEAWQTAYFVLFVIKQSTSHRYKPWSKNEGIGRAVCEAAVGAVRERK